MPVDDCRHTFQELATKILPAYMKRMKQAILHPIPMETFASAGVRHCRNCLADETRGDKDFSGCYLLLEDQKPLYVGISRKIISRLQQHVKGKDHYSASLAYRVACHHQPHEHHRGVAMKDLRFLKAFEKAKQQLRRMSAAVIRIDCPVELYGFELYCSMELHTDQWNTFRTH